MTKNPRRHQKSTRRSTSSSQHPAQEILKARKRKSTSSGPVLRTCKQRFIRRILRRGADLDASQLLEIVAPFVTVKKRVPESDVDRSEESEVDDIRRMPKTPFSPLCRLRKLKPQAKTKRNNPAAIKLLKFSSVRHTIVAPCFDEDKIMTQDDPRLMSTYHKDVREEDCDSTDSYIQMGLNKGLRSLFSALESRSYRAKMRNRACPDSNPEEAAPIKLRTRLSSPAKINTRKMPEIPKKYQN